MEQQTRLWDFWIDVGGTFTDVVARDPQGKLLTHKRLSSGWVKGSVTRLPDTADSRRLFDERRQQDPAGIWRGQRLRLLGTGGEVLHESTVVDSEASGWLQLESGTPHLSAGLTYEMTGDEPAPIGAIRYLLGLSRHEDIPPVRIRLGTTRGTNALLERRGARTLYVTTRGFEDALLIGNQARPRLFDLAIRQAPPLYEQVLAVDERIAADGEILRAPIAERVRRELRAIRDRGIEAVAICLLHAYRNPAHELLLETWAEEAGFTEISVSHRVSPLIKLISRGDTTLLNAYLNPVLRDYLAAIQQAVPGSPLELMTSAGGLVAAGQFRGKDSILSGPAGGVVGAADIARECGFQQAIGFDMGGTSTDVSRFDTTEEFPLEYETEKAGVRISTPVLGIETVAAGGGSICRFDGVRLLVGPESAGADPGPCCYGRGGPLTVTDMNLITGRILPERFPFPLDVAAVERKLAEMAREVAAAPLGRAYAPRELAEGFLDIANTRMSRAIARISSAKGFDPAEHVLVTFGGAGGQHACALARELGMRWVLLHPWAGVLSAYGIGKSLRKQHAEQAVLRRLDEISPADLNELFHELTARARQELDPASEIPDAQLTSRCSLDLRYRGRETTLNIVAESLEEYRSHYAAEHQRRFGFLLPEFPLEATAARVELTWQTTDTHTHTTTTGSQTTNPHSTPVWFREAAEAAARYASEWDSAPRAQPLRETLLALGSQEMTAGVYERTQLASGEVVVGPAIIGEDISTLFLEYNCRGLVLPDGEILVEVPADSNSAVDTKRTPSRSCEQSTEPTPDQPADPVALEIFHQHFASIAEQMGEALRQTAHSVNVKERLDYSCAVFDPAGELVANAPHIPVHLGAMSETVKSLLAEVPNLQAGDAYVTNDPYRGGSHLPDVTVISPFVSATGELQALVASRAHHAEIGGITPGSMPPFSQNLAEEGVVLRNVRLLEQGQPRFAELRERLTSGPYPSRNPEENLADVQAQLAANRIGLELLTQLAQRHGAKRMLQFMQLIREASAEKTRLALRSLPATTQHFSDVLDNGSPISVNIQVEHGRAMVDFTGTGPVLPGNLNANRAIVTAALMYVFRCLIGTDTPLNGGLLDPIEVRLPVCLLNPPRHDDPAQCAAMVGGNVETSQRIVDVLLAALNLAAASQGTMNNLTFGNETFGYYETIGGGSGATAEAAGCHAVHTHMTNTRLTDAEVLEVRYPIRLTRFGIRPDSGGMGALRGGNGMIREYEFLAPLTVSMLSQRRLSDHPPFGLQGGGPGEPGRNVLYRANQQALSDTPESPSPAPTPTPGQLLEGSFRIQVQPGDRLAIHTPGGGAWGAVEP